MFRFGGLTSVVKSSSCVMRLFSDSSVPRRLDFTIPVSELVASTISLHNANSQQIVQHQKQLSVKKFQKHTTDTGSAGVQVAAMTDDIRNLARHFAVNKKDNHGKRGFTMLVQKRLRMMKYLMRTDYPEFVRVSNDLELQKEANLLIKRSKHVK